MMRRIMTFVISLVFLSSAALSAYAAADIDVLSWMWYRGDLGYYKAVGEVVNSGSSSARFVMLTCTWYSTDGSVVGTDFTFAMLDIIGPGEKSPFVITLLEDGVRPDRARLQWEWDATDEIPDRSVRVRDISAEYDALTDCLEAVGEVENTGGQAARFVMIVITGYNEDGEVVAADFTFTTLDTVSAGGTSPFKAYICDQAREIARYRYIVQHD